MTEPTRGHRLMIRQLMRRCRKASLGTLIDGAPYVSLVTVATDQAGCPLLLLSGLSDHTRNLTADPRVSLLFDGTEGFANPQEGPRATILGTATRTTDEVVRRRFLACHPGAALYAGFGDFAFWRVEVARVHWVGGFARALWFEDGITLDEGLATRFAAAESSMIEHMSADHADAVARIAARPGEWRISAGDCDGVDIADQTSSFRMAFAEPVSEPQDWRKALAALASHTGGNT